MGFWGNAAVGNSVWGAIKDTPVGTMPQTTYDPVAMTLPNPGNAADLVRYTRANNLAAPEGQHFTLKDPSGVAKNSSPWAGLGILGGMLTAGLALPALAGGGGAAAAAGGGAGAGSGGLSTAGLLSATPSVSGSALTASAPAAAGAAGAVSPWLKYGLPIGADIFQTANAMRAEGKATRQMQDAYGRIADLYAPYNQYGLQAANALATGLGLPGISAPMGVPAMATESAAAPAPAVARRAGPSRWEQEYEAQSLNEPSTIAAFMEQARRSAPKSKTSSSYVKKERNAN